MSSQRPRFIATPTVLVTLATTVPGLLVGLSGPRFAGTFATSLVFGGVLLVSTVGMARAERREGSTALTAMLGTYGGLVAASLVLTEGRAFLVAMPFISMLVLYLSLAPTSLGLALLTLVMSQIFAQRLSGTTLAGAIAQFVSAEVFVVVFSLIARRERYARAHIERLNRQVAELATARERNRLARELHDSLGHCLTIVSVQLEAARATKGGDDERLARIQQVVRNGLAELRSAVTLLREGPARPLPAALEGLVAECDAAGLPVTLQITGARRPLIPEVELTLFRAAQEALTNVQRHARASGVGVSLAYDLASVKLAVADDGVGSGAVASRDGHGLMGLRERVTQLGGRVAIDAGAAGGFTLVVEVPTR